MKLKHAKELWANSDIVGRQMALKYYSKEELEEVELPKSWKDIGTNNIAHPTKELIDASFAIAKLAQLMKVYNGDWVADYTTQDNKYVINLGAVTKSINSTWTRREPFFLTFQTPEKRDHFFKHHLDLIEEAAPILFGISFESGEAKGISFVELAKEDKKEPAKEIEREGFVIEGRHGWYACVDFVEAKKIEAIIEHGRIFKSLDHAKNAFLKSDKEIHKLIVYTDGSYDLIKAHEAN